MQDERRSHMICPVDLAHEIFALRAARVGDHQEHGLISEAAVERAMKMQEVMLRAMAKKINGGRQPRS